MIFPQEGINTTFYQRQAKRKQKYSPSLKNPYLYNVNILITVLEHLFMRQILFLGILICIASCHRSMEPWPYDGDKQTVSIQTSMPHLDGFYGLPANCQLFVYDESKQYTDKQDAQQEGSKNRYQAKLFPGTYTGYCVTNASESSYWKYDRNSSPEAISLKSQPQGGSRDHLMGQCEMEVKAEGTNVFNFQMERKVGQLLIVVHNMPEWLTDLQLKVNNIPKSISLTGIYDKGTHTVQTDAAQAIGGVSTTQLLVFPPQNSKRSQLTLTSAAHKYVSEEYEIQEIVANKITRIDVTFEEVPEMNIIDFTTTLVEWDRDTIQEEWETPAPEQEKPCEGSGDGYNMVNNPDFEEEFIEGIPMGWKLDGSGKSKLIKQVMLPVHHGNHAVQLNGATYLYQDIFIEGGSCYQLKIFAYAPNEKIKWRYWCTWMQGSTPLNSFSAELHPNNYWYQTDGYIDALEGKIVRAPINATRLRMEIRTYTGTPEDGEGLYVDGVSVEKVY